MKRGHLLFLIILFKGIPSYCCSRDTVRLFYDINQKELSLQNQAKLDSLNRQLTNAASINIVGYADYLGPKDFNQLLSKKRAETVEMYLSGMHGGKLQITTDGRGAVKQAGRRSLSVLGEPLNRRVDIVVTVSAVTKVVRKDTATNKKDKGVYNRINSITSLNIGESVSFKELTFQPGRHFLRPEALPYLDSLTAILKRHPGLEIEIQGHICCQLNHEDGIDLDTQKNDLSLNRAKYVYDYLVNNGISTGRMRYRGLGSTDPKVFPEQTVADQNLNRRVQIVLLSK